MSKVLKNFVISGIVVSIFALLPIVMKTDGDYFLTLMIQLFIHTTLAQSWNLMGGYTGQFNLGLSAYFGSGVLCYSLLYSTGIPYYVAMLAGGAIAMVLACIIGGPALRLKGIYFAIGTLALAEVLRIIVANNFSLAVYVPASHWEKFRLSNAYYLGLTVNMITMATVYTVANSRIGLAIRAIRDEEDAATAIGINPAKFKFQVFLISSFLAGLAGGVFSYYRGIIIPYEQFTALWTFGPIVSSCIGGLGTITGPIWGSIIFVILQEVLSRTVGQAHFIVTGIIFILIILFLPGGLVQSGVMIRRLLAAPHIRKSEINS
ncbi:branched-chain amino acid ABC transporter permease [Thermodesulfobacteriota bacterium]